MTRKEAINVLKNEIQCVLRDSCERSECASCELVMPVEQILSAYDMAIAALQEQEERENPKPRKVQRYPDTKNVWTYYDPEMKNPCGCGSNCYHYEYDGQKIIGVCNGCGKDIYEVKPEYIQEYLDKGIWE